MVNDHEESARARKVMNMVRYFDQRFLATGRCPFRHAAALARMLKDGTTALEWSSHAILAGQNKPSPTTVAQIIAVYERRASARLDNVISLLGRSLPDDQESLGR